MQKFPHQQLRLCIGAAYLLHIVAAGFLIMYIRHYMKVIFLTHPLSIMLLFADTAAPPAEGMYTPLPGLCIGAAYLLHIVAAGLFIMYISHIAKVKSRSYLSGLIFYSETDLLPDDNGLKAFYHSDAGLFNFVKTKKSVLLFSNSQSIIFI